MTTETLSHSNARDSNYWISWKRRIALPGISEWQSFCITVGASSAENSVCGGGLISPEATLSTSCLSCSMDPGATASIFWFLSCINLENLGNSRSATSSLTNTTPPCNKYLSLFYILQKICKLFNILISWFLDKITVNAIGFWYCL